MPKFTERPPDAAPLFDSASGQLAVSKRWDAQKQRNRDALIEAVAKQLDIDPEDTSYDEALKSGILYPLFMKAMVEGKTAAQKLALQLLGEMPDHADAKVVVDNRQVNFMSLRLTPSSARTYIEDQRTENPQLAAIVEASVDFEADAEVVQIVSIPVE